MTIRLNLASGVNIFEGNDWVNLDVVPQWPNITKKCDLHWDARTDAIPFGDNSVEEIYCGFLLLHLAPYHHKRVTEDMRRVLRPGGQLWIVEVDMDLVMRRYLEDPTDARTCELIWGEQGNFHGEPYAEFDKHCHGYTQASLINFLTKTGFGHFNIGKNSDPISVYYETHIKCVKL